MKMHQLFGARPAGRTLAVAGLTATTAFVFGAQNAYAATDVEVWLALNAHNEQVFEKLVKQFNSEQKDVRVSLKSFKHVDDIDPALEAAVKAKKTPNLVQLEDNNAPETIASRKYIQPLYEVVAKAPLKNTDWFVSSANGFMRDSKGRLLAFPYMMEIPVMYYNVDAFKKAGLNPTVPDRSWQGLQDQLVDLANKATRNCPVTTNMPASINLENLAAVNNQYFLSNENGLKGKSTPTFSFDTLFVRHLSLMISWVRSELMTGPAYQQQALQRFTNKECAVLITNSGNLGAFRSIRGLDFGVSGLPYYPQVTSKPGNPFVDGGALWAVKGHDKQQDNATAQFLAWLAQPKQAAHWYQQTGFLPLTKQAFASTDDGYYKGLGEWKDLVAVYAKEPPLTARNFRIQNYPQIEDMFEEVMEKALKGEESAPVALSSAASRAKQISGSK